MPVFEPRRRGFTLIELLVVMAIIATLLSVALPKYFGSLDRAKEATLRQSLTVMREAIDKFYADNGRYPEQLEELASRRYLRDVPVDPITGERGSWVIVRPPDGSGAKGMVYDLHSGAPGKAADGRDFSSL
jgi:general secretion pathway protein G